MVLTLGYGNIATTKNYKVLVTQQEAGVSGRQQSAHSVQRTVFSWYHAPLRDLEQGSSPTILLTDS